MIAALLDRSRGSGNAPYGGMGENDRQNAINSLFSTVLEPRNSQLVNARLASVHAEGRRSRALDVGTGTGAWAFTIANAQPYADVTALDVEWANFQQGNAVHGNIDFRTVDVSRPLPLEANVFDVIHVQSMLLDIPNYPILLERLARCLRPGGIMVVVELEPQFLAASGDCLPQPLRQWDAAVREAYREGEIDVNLPSRMLSCLSSSGVFGEPVYHQEVGIPCGGYMRGEEATLTRARYLHSQVISASMRAMMPTLIDFGYGEADLEELHGECMAVISAPNARYYQRLFAVYACKVL